MRRPRLFRTIIFIILIFLRISYAQASVKDTANRFWVSVGGGCSSVQNQKWEMSGGFSANVSRKGTLIGARADFNSEFRLFETPLKNYEYALYAGKYFIGYNQLPFAAIGTGISLLNYYTYGAQRPSSGFLGNYHELDPHYRVGLAFDAQCGLHLGRFCSIGVHGFLSIVPQHTIGGALLSFRIGNLASAAD